MKPLVNSLDQPLNVYYSSNQFQSLVRKLGGERRKIAFVDGRGVVFDVVNDETVLINPKAKEALKWLKEEGLFVVLWTGGGKLIIPHMINHGLEDLIDIILYNDNFVIEDQKERKKALKKLLHFNENSDLQQDYKVNQDFSFEEKIGNYTAGVKLFFLLWKNAILIEDSNTVSGILFNDFGADPTDMIFASIENYQRIMQVLKPSTWCHNLDQSETTFSVELLRRYLDPQY